MEDGKKIAKVIKNILSLRNLAKMRFMKKVKNLTVDIQFNLEMVGTRQVILN